jgi:hypothetical protein
MPFANKFRAMMDFPFPGEAIGDFIVERVEVCVLKEDAAGIEYGVEMTLRELGGSQTMRREQEVRRACKAFFAQHPTTFSGYGNPYQLWFHKPQIENLGEGRYAVTVKGSGARVYLEPELRRFLQHLNAENRLATPLAADAQETLVTAYLDKYKREIQRQVGRYTRKLDKSREMETT